MSSWFHSLTENLVEKVHSAGEVLEKLTLTTPELLAERRKIDEEEKRKEHVMDMLASLLPWETNDAERDILVEECKEAILNLSMSRDTFYGPYELPKLGAKTTTDDDEEDDKQQQEASSVVDPNKDMPSKESLEKLAKLEPLPTLLENFDFHAHVGLISRMLALDPKLVQMQAKESGGGLREKVFWRNYFFHCAYTRYEAGLSIDEIWSEHALEERKTFPSTTTTPPPSQSSQQQGTETNSSSSNDPTVEETITFEPDVHDEEETGGESKSATISGAGTSVSLFTEAMKNEKIIADVSESAASDFEMVANIKNDMTKLDNNNVQQKEEEEEDTLALGGDEDYELDELEAEIARELEDD